MTPYRRFGEKEMAHSWSPSSEPSPRRSHSSIIRILSGSVTPTSFHFDVFDVHAVRRISPTACAVPLNPPIPAILDVPGRCVYSPGERGNDAFPSRVTGAMVLVAVLVSAALSSLAAAQDFPTFPDHPKGDEESLWFREPNVGYGPLNYASMSLFPSLRSGFETHFPESMPSGKFDFRVNESWVKFSSSSDLWRIDYEVVRTNLGFSWALSDDVRLDLSIES